MTWEIRIGGEFTEDDLRPDIYETPSGLVEARLHRGGNVAEIDAILQTYAIDGGPCVGYELPQRPGKTILTKDGTELNGAVTAFAYAGVLGVALRTGFAPPHPDLEVAVDGETAGLEMTQARPDGAFTAALRDTEARLIERAANDDALRQVTEQRRIGVGFVDLPPRAQLPAMVDAVARWLGGHDWTTGDPVAPTDPLLANYVTACVGWSGADKERPIRAQWHTNARPMPSGHELILNALSEKKTKHYGSTSPLWLGINAPMAFGAMPTVKRARIDPGQFDRIYITDAQDAVTLIRQARP